MWFTALWDHGLSFYQWGAVIIAALLGATFDVSTRKVPNVLSGTILATGFVWAFWLAGPSGLADAAAGCVMLLMPFLLLFVFGGGGAGDAKLMAGLGAWLGVVNGAVCLVCVAVSGVVMAVGFALVERRLGQVLRNVLAVSKAALFFLLIKRPRDISVELPRAQDMRKMPYGPSIFAGACLAAIGVFMWNVC